MRRTSRRGTAAWDASDRWRFLLPWFKELRFLYHVDPVRYDTDDVRLGREPHDWRINVGIESDEDGENVQKKIKRMRTTREALIITSMLAEVDYETWLREIKRNPVYKTRPFLDLETHKLKRAFSLVDYSTEEPEYFAWQRMQHFCGDENYSPKFMKDLAKLAQIAAEEGVNVYQMETISLEFELTASSLTRDVAAQVSNVRGMCETASKMLEIEEKQRASGARKVPVFRLDGITLNLREFRLHTSLLTELRRLVELGVPIKSLALPDKVIESEGANGEEFLSAWVALVRALTGQGMRPTKVDRLILPFWCCQDPFLATLCSALPTARGLRFVRLETMKKSRGCRDEEVESEAEREAKRNAAHRMWGWLASGLFHPSSSSSVEALNLQVPDLHDEDLNYLERILATNEDPVVYMWRHESKIPARGNIFHPRHVVVMKGTALKLTGGSSEKIVTHESISGIVMTEDEDTTSSPLDVLLPGFGFCQVDQSNLQNKKQRQLSIGTAASSAELDQTPRLQRRGLKTLLLEVGSNNGADDDESGSDDEIKEASVDDRTGALVSRLIGLVGQRLTSLSIASSAVDDNVLTACLEASPPSP